MIKRHVLLVISDKPVDIRSLSRRSDVRHLVREELTLTPNQGIVGWNVKKKVCYYSDKIRRDVFGVGKSESVAIVNWLKVLVSSILYEPKWMKRKKEEEK